MNPRTACLAAGLILALGWPWAASAKAPGNGLVAGINGTVTLERKGGARALRPGERVGFQDVLVTAEDGKVRVLFDDDSILTVGPRSRVKIRALRLEPDKRRLGIEVLAGRFRMAVSKFFGSDSYVSVQTPTAVAGVRGTVLWGDTELDALCALEGDIAVKPVASETIRGLSAGECVGGMGQGKTDALQPSAEDLAKFLAEVTLER